VKIVALLIAASLAIGAAPAKPKLRGTTDLAVARDGSLLVGDISNRVLRLRGGRLTRVATIGFPVEVAIDPRGGFAVASNETRIRRVDARGRVSTLASRLAQITALAFDAQGNVYFSELGGRVRRLDRATRRITTVVDSGLNQPHGLVVDGGTLYVCDTFNSRLVAIDLVSGAVRTHASGFQIPVDVDRGPDGALFVADAGGNRIARVAGGEVTTVARLISPNGIAVARNGTIYVTERLLPRVRAVNPATGAVRTIVGSP
jgi:sugar lactone lactonase YvrE